MICTFRSGLYLTNLLGKEQASYRHVTLRHASDYTPNRYLPFSISREEADTKFKAYHRSPLTNTPRLSNVEQKYLSFYLFDATAKTQYRASIGRTMSMPYRDSQTGKIHQRQRIVWTTLPQIHEINSDYTQKDKQSQVYAGLEQYEELVNKFLPIHTTAFVNQNQSRVSEEKFQMTSAYAQTKLKERVIEHASQIAREMLMQEYGANVRINEMSVEISLKSTVRAFYPAWIFNTTSLAASRPLKYLVSGVTGKITGLKSYDPTLSGATAGGVLATLFFFLFSSPIFSFLMLGVGYLAANTIAKWLPIWRTMRWEGRRAADLLANQQHGGTQQQGSGFSGFGNFNPFDAFSGRTGGRNPFNDFDPFAGAGSFNGQRRSSDPFYGAGRSNQSRQQQQGQSQTRPKTQDLYATLGVSKTATQDDITTAFRKLALSKHPDKVPADQKASASHEFAKINEAYRVLRSPGKRDQYDRYGVI